MPFYSGNYGGPLGQFDPRPMMQAASAQAQMYQNLGSQFGNVISKYFKKKEETKMVESMAENPIALQVVYGDQGTVPTDQKERVKDIRGIVRASGGPGAFMARMDNAELKTQNKQIIDQNTALKAEQLRGLEQARLEREKQITAREDFGKWLTTRPPGQLPSPEGDPYQQHDLQMEGQLRSPSPPAPSPTFGRAEAPMNLSSSAAFREQLAGSGMGPRPTMMGMEYGQDIRAAEQAAATARLAATSAGLDIGKKRVDLAKLIPEAVNKLTRQGIMDFKLDEVRDIYMTYDQFIKALDDGQIDSISANVARDKLARLLQPTGILTDSDISRIGESGALLDRIDQLFADAEGELTEANYTQMLKAANSLLATAQTTVEPAISGIAKAVANTYGDLNVTPKYVLEHSMLKEYTKFPWETQARGWNPTGGGGGGGGTGGPVTTKSGFIVGDVTPIKPVQPAPTVPPAQPQAPTTAIEQDIRHRLQIGQQPQKILLWYQQQGPDVYQQAIDAYEKLVRRGVLPYSAPR